MVRAAIIIICLVSILLLPALIYFFVTRSVRKDINTLKYQAASADTTRNFKMNADDETTTQSIVDTTNATVHRESETQPMESKGLLQYYSATKLKRGKTYTLEQMPKTLDFYDNGLKKITFLTHDKAFKELSLQGFHNPIKNINNLMQNQLFDIKMNLSELKELTDVHVDAIQDENDNRTILSSGNLWLNNIKKEKDTLAELPINRISITKQKGNFSLRYQFGNRKHVLRIPIPDYNASATLQSIKIYARNPQITILVD